MRKVARGGCKAIREWIADGIGRRDPAIESSDPGGADRRKRHRPGGFAELKIRREVIDAGAGSNHRFVVHAVSDTQAGCEQLEVLGLHSLFRMLARENEIERAEDGLPIYQD